MYFLVTDVFKRKTFDLIFILKKNRNNNIIYCSNSNSWINKIIFFLIYRSFNLYKLDSIEDFDFIQNKYKDKQIIFFPIEEESILLFYEFQSINFNIVSCLPERSIFEMSRNKKLLYNFCLNNNITTPKCFLIFDHLIDFPVIVKPIIGSGSNGIKILNEFNSEFKNISCDDFLIQQYMPNGANIIGAFAFAVEGKIISYYFHKRIRTYPESGGVSVLAITVYDDLLLNNYFKPLIKKLNWSGLIMVEFLFNENDGLFYLIEINPRIWGSILLSDFCDSLLIDNYINYLSNQSLTEGIYKESFMIRWVFPYDIFYWIKNSFKPLNYFTNNENTCFINFSNSDILSSLFFVIFTYFRLSKVIKFFK